MLSQAVSKKAFEEAKDKTILTKNVTEFVNVIVLGFCDGQTCKTITATLIYL